MKKTFAIAAVVGVALLTGSTLWRAADTRATSDALLATEPSSAAVSASQRSAAETSSSSSIAPGLLAQDMPLSLEAQSEAEGAEPEAEGEEAAEEGEAEEPAAVEPEPAAAPESAPAAEETSPQPPASARPQTALEPLPTSGIFHGQVEYVTAVPGAEQRPATQTEFWIDLETGDARLSEKEAGGNSEAIRIRSGANQTALFPQDKRARTQVAPDAQAAYLNEIRDSVLGYRFALDQGAFVILGEDVMNGQPVIRVRPQGPGPDLTDIYLGKDHGLLVKEVTYRLSESGAREEVQTRTFTYRLVETVARSQVASDLFSPAIPSDWESLTTRPLDLTAAGAFRLFDLYWLGSEYAGMSLVGMFHDEMVQSSNQFNAVIMDYAQPVTDPQTTTAPNQLRVVLRPPLSAEEQAARGRGGPPGAETVTISGRRGSLFTPQAPQGGSGQQDITAAQAPPTLLELPMDRAVVVLYGKDRAQVVQAARDLQKLN